jgi:Fe/S biogenesis protein NfuA
MSEIETIIEITDAAVDKIKSLIDSRERGELAVRVVLRGALPGGKYQSEFKFVEPSEATSDDLVQDTGKFKLLISNVAAKAIKGAKVDFNEERYAAGFNIEYPTRIMNNPAAERRQDWQDPVAIKVQELIDAQINPGIAAHGGWVVMEDYEDNTVYLEMGGGCQGCSLSAVTLREGIEELIRHNVPEVQDIVDVTDHVAGETPYYTAEGESPLA